MYDNENELDDPLSRIIHITIINSLIPKTDIGQKILEKTSYEYKDRLKFNVITSTKDLYKPLSEEKENPKKGMIDINWLKDIYEKPCLILLFYHIEQTGAETNLEFEQQKIYNILQEIKRNDNNIFIFLFIIYKEKQENPFLF